MENVVSHSGKIVSVSDTHVFVKINREGACEGCKNVKSCQINKSEDTIITVYTEQANIYCVDEEVLVIMKTSLGLKAVVYAYLLPLVFLLATFLIVSQFIHSEIIQILLAFIPVIVYYIILYIIRDRLEKTFQFFVAKK